jgi:hypothetical protein
MSKKDNKDIKHLIISPTQKNMILKHDKFNAVKDAADIKKGHIGRIYDIDVWTSDTLLGSNDFDHVDNIIMTFLKAKAEAKDKEFNKKLAEYRKDNNEQKE